MEAIWEVVLRLLQRPVEALEDQDQWGQADLGLRTMAEDQVLEEGAVGVPDRVTCILSIGKEVRTMMMIGVDGVVVTEDNMIVLERGTEGRMTTGTTEVKGQTVVVGTGMTERTTTTRGGVVAAETGEVLVMGAVTLRGGIATGNGEIENIESDLRIGIMMTTENEAATDPFVARGMGDSEKSNS